MIPAEALYHSKTCKYRCIEIRLPHKNSYLSSLTPLQYKRELHSQHSIRKYITFFFSTIIPSFPKCYSVVRYLIGPTASVFFFFYLPSSFFSDARNCDNFVSRIARRVRYACAFQWAHVRRFQSLYYTIYGNMPTSSSSGVLALFSPRNKLLCWFEAYSYVFTAQTTGLWKTACDSLAQTRETAQIYRSRILIAPPTSAYTQYK